MGKHGVLSSKIVKDKLILNDSSQLKAGSHGVLGKPIKDHLESKKLLGK